MPIVRTIQSFNEFAESFRSMGRGGQFQNLEWLYDYLEEYSDSCGEPVELDVISLCCEYTEMTYDEIACEHTDIDLSHFIDGDDVGADEDLVKERVLDYLRDHTSVCGYDDETVLYAQF